MTWKNARPSSWFLICEPDPFLAALLHLPGDDLEEREALQLVLDLRAGPVLGGLVARLGTVDVVRAGGAPAVGAGQAVLTAHVLAAGASLDRTELDLVAVGGHPSPLTGVCTGGRLRDNVRRGVSEALPRAPLRARGRIHPRRRLGCDGVGVDPLGQDPDGVGGVPIRHRGGVDELLVVELSTDGTTGQGGDGGLARPLAADVERRQVPHAGAGAVLVRESSNTGSTARVF